MSLHGTRSNEQMADGPDEATLMLLSQGLLERGPFARQESLRPSR